MALIKEIVKRDDISSENDDSLNQKEIVNAFISWYGTSSGTDRVSEALSNRFSELYREKNV